MFTHWVQNTTTAMFSGTGVNVVSVTVNSPNQRDGGRKHRPGGGSDARNVTLTTNAEVGGR